MLNWLKSIARSSAETEAYGFVFRAMKAYAKDPDTRYFWSLDVMGSDFGKTRAEILEALTFYTDLIERDAELTSCFYLR